MPQPSDDTELRRLCHGLRGAVNEMRLCVEALRVETDPRQALEWLDLIERAAGRCEVLVSRLAGRD